jgi:hypothetical protein
MDIKKCIFIKYRYHNEKYCALWDKQKQIFIANTKADEVFNNLRSFYSFGFAKYRAPTGKDIYIAVSSYYDGAKNGANPPKKRRKNWS